MIWLPSADETSLCVSTPAKGNNANGISEATGMGIASVTQNITVNKVIAAVHASSCDWAKKWLKPNPVISAIKNAHPIIVSCLLVIISCIHVSFSNLSKANYTESVA